MNPAKPTMPGMMAVVIRPAMPTTINKTAIAFTKGHLFSWIVEDRAHAIQCGAEPSCSMKPAAFVGLGRFRHCGHSQASAPDFESLEAVPARWSALNGARRRKARRRTFSRGDAMENQLLQQKQRNTRNPMPESRAAMEPMIPGMPTMGRTAERIRPTMPTTIRAIMIAFTECTSLCVCADCAARGILCTSRTACQKSPNGLFAQVNEIERTRLRA